MIEINKESEKKAFVHKILGRKRMILVTGGAGYIGSHTCIELIEQGHEIVVVDNLINSAVEAISRIEEITGKSVAFIEGDVRDESVLCDIFNQFKIVGLGRLAMSNISIDDFRTCRFMNL